MTEDKYNFIFDPKISVSDKRLLMCFANYWHGNDDLNDPTLRIEGLKYIHLQNEFEKITHHADRKYMIPDLRRHIKNAKMCRLITLEKIGDALFVDQTYANKVLKIGEKFTADDYAKCKVKNIEHAPSYASYIAKKIIK